MATNFTNYEDWISNDEDSTSECDEYEVERPVTPAFTSYKEVLAYFRRFLNREFERSPCDRFEEETQLIQSHLLAINAGGILSFSSQPGTIVTIEEDMYYQRSYLSCYMPRNLAHKLRGKLVPQGIIVLVGEFDMLTNDIGELFDNFQEGADHLEGSGLSRENVMEDDGAIVVTRVVFEGQSEPHTRIIPRYKFGDLEFILDNTTEEHRQIIKENLVQVHFIDRKWGSETELFDKLVEILAQ